MQAFLFYDWLAQVTDTSHIIVLVSSPTGCIALQKGEKSAVKSNCFINTSLTSVSFEVIMYDYEADYV